MSNSTNPRVPAAWANDQYQLLDFGDGRKLERFGTRVLDRACPAADTSIKSQPALWDAADLVLDGPHDRQPRQQPGANTEWQVAHGDLRFRLKLTPFGHVGLFPEQSGNWHALAGWVQQRLVSGKSTSALNLFAYTGGSTLALSQAGAEVVHVDASAPAVNWARENARLSGLEERPVRWIVEDARKYVRREIKRGKTYDLLVLDPPSFGHGPKGQRWEITLDLPDFLNDLCQLLDQSRDYQLLLTAHCQQPDMQTIAGWLQAALPAAQVAQTRLRLLDLQGRALDAGFCVNACK